MTRGLAHPDTGAPVVLAQQPPPRRRLTSRVGLLHVVSVASGLLAFVLVLTWMGNARDLVTVAVAGDTIKAGSIVSPGSVEFVEVATDASFDGRLLSPDEAGRLDGAVATREISPGEPLLDSDLRPVDLPVGLRAMSVPLDPQRAAGGDLAVGDRVDLIGTGDDGTGYIAISLPVLAVPGQQDAAFGAGGGFAVTVAVDEAEALAIAAALDTGTVHLLRSTGAPEIPAGLLEPPGAVEDTVVGGGGD